MRGWFHFTLKRWVQSIGLLQFTYVVAYLLCHLLGLGSGWVYSLQLLHIFCSSLPESWARYILILAPWWQVQLLTPESGIIQTNAWRWRERERRLQTLLVTSSWASQLPTCPYFLHFLDCSPPNCLPYGLQALAPGTETIVSHRLYLASHCVRYDVYFIYFLVVLILWGNPGWYIRLDCFPFRLLLS